MSGQILNILISDAVGVGVAGMPNFKPSNALLPIQRLSVKPVSQSLCFRKDSGEQNLEKWAHIVNLVLYAISWVLFNLSSDLQ